MYIWRNKNRRDRRNFLTSGPALWGPPDGSLNTDINDEIFRQQQEKAFVDNAKKQIRLLIYNYLNTKHGKEESKAVAIEIENLRKSNAQLSTEKKEVITPAIRKKRNIYEIFRKFDVDGKGSLDREELRFLLHELKIALKEDELTTLIADLDVNGNNSINFSEFYPWFLKESNQSKTIWRSIINSTIIFGLTSSFEDMIKEVEAANLIVDSVVTQTEQDALKEYRIAHPPLFGCPSCTECFLNQQELQGHIRKPTLHEEKEQRAKELQSRFTAIENAFVGAQGRKLLAHRLLFSVDLGGTASRMKVASLDPYRPMISDPLGKREEQLRRGMLVQGEDPSAGIRAIPRQKGLARQHRAPGAVKNDMTFPDLMAELIHTQDQQIDTVITAEGGEHTDVRFGWKDFVLIGVDILGEFNGWKPEALNPDPITGKYFIVKSLVPGRYRYSYVVDRVSTIDLTASTIEEDGKIVNIIQVCNPSATSGVERERRRRNRRYDVPMTIPPSPMPGSIVALTSKIEKVGDTTTTTATPTSINDNNKITSPESSPSTSPGVTGKVVTKLPLLQLKNKAASQISSGGGGGVDSLLPSLSLNDIVMRNAALSDDGVYSFAKSIKQNSVIITIDLSHNSISDNGILALSSAIPSLLALRTLKLNGNGFGFDGIRYLSREFKNSKVIERLELSRNNLGDDSAECISQLIIYHPSIKAVYLDCCFIGNDGCEHLAQALIKNRTLEVLSLCENRIFSSGLDRIGISLRCNGSLRELRLDGNALGPQGAQCIGDTLICNDTLQIISMSNTMMSQNKAVYGVHAISYALRKNRSLHTLILKNNDIFEEGIIEIANCLVYNRGLRELDLTGNRVSKTWLEPNAYYLGRGNLRVPSIRTSLDRNRAILHNPELMQRLFIHPRPMDDTFEGLWTHHRKWKAVVTKLSIAMATDALSEREAVRMAAEEAEIAELMANETRQLELFLVTSEGRRVISGISKVITQYLKELSQRSSTHIEEWVEDCHLAFVAEAFLKLGADPKTYSISTDRLMDVMTSLAIPVKDSDLVQLVTDPASGTKLECIGIKRFLQFYRDHHSRLCELHRMDRLRLMSERIMFRSDTKDCAKNILMRNTIRTKRSEAIRKHRSQSFQEPAFMCTYCECRFTNLKSLERHQRRLKEHRWFILSSQIWESEHQVLLRAKRFTTGTSLPAYFILNPKIKLHKDLSPQIFDTRGGEGRPIGVVEPDITVRVEDSLGDWMHVRHDNGLGWIQFREGNFNILVPACQEVRGFWDKLKTYSRPVFYRMSDNLPEAVEIKVRQKPVSDGIICGFLTRGMVVESWASLGPWLQIRYDDMAAVWVRRESGGRQLLLKLENSLQRRMAVELTKSPCVVEASKLLPRPEDLDDDSLDFSEDSIGLSTVLSSVK